MRAGLLLAAALLAWVAAGVAAHPLDPSLLQLEEGPGGIVEVLWREPAAAPRGARLTPILPPFCRQLAPAELVRGESRLSLRWKADCGGRLAGARLAVTGLTERGTETLLRVRLADGREAQAVLRGEASSYRVPETPSWWAIVLDYGRLGCLHILGGYDHLLFVLGLLFLVQGRRALISTVTAFTLGHSLTLAAAALGWARLPSAPVEAAIALSIFLLAVELARPAAERSRRPWRMAAAFGLLHGFGFAGALAEAGLPQGAIPLALAAFNLGIEIGQLGFIAAALLALAALDRLPLRGEPGAAHQRLARPAAYLIGILSFYWLLERLAAV